MASFADNLRRLCTAAGLSVTEAGHRLGARSAEVAAWERPGASLPELPVLVRLADAIGCLVDDLLEGEDADFDHPQRRHAALIAARMGRVRTLLTQVRLARHRGELRAEHETRLDEASLMVTIDRCRAWVMSEHHDVAEAAAIEADLDAHVGRVRDVLEGTAPRPQAPRPRPATRARIVTAPAPAPSPAPQAAPAGARAATEATADRPPRRPGHHSTLWAQDYADQAHACVLVTNGTQVDVELRVEDRVLETRTCRTLDEAFQQSSEWKRTYLVPAIVSLPDMPH